MGFRVIEDAELERRANKAFEDCQTVLDCSGLGVAEALLVIECLREDVLKQVGIRYFSISLPCFPAHTWRLAYYLQ